MTVIEEDGRLPRGSSEKDAADRNNMSKIVFLLPVTTEYA
jgi:hypothetical protein